MAAASTTDFPPPVPPATRPTTTRPPIPTTTRPGSRSPARPVTTRRLGRRRLRPHPDRLPAHRRARRSGVPELPRRRRLQRASHRLRLLPPGRLRRDHRSRPRRGRDIPLTCADLPQHDAVGRRRLRPRADRLPAHRLTHRSGVPQLPRRRRLQRTAAPRAPPVTRTDYDATTDPDHDAAGFPISCQTCHNTTAWPGAVFDHNQSQFPLTGAHLAVECMSCHGGGVYNGLPTACASCHQADYDATTDPDHDAGRVSRSSARPATTPPPGMAPSSTTPRPTSRSPAHTSFRSA